MSDNEQAHDAVMKVVEEQSTPALMSKEEVIEFYRDLESEIRFRRNTMQQDLRGEG